MDSYLCHFHGKICGPLLHAVQHPEELCETLLDATHHPEELCTIYSLPLSAWNTLAMIGMNCTHAYYRPTIASYPGLQTSCHTHLHGELSLGELQLCI